MDLYEYQGKQFFARYGIPVSPGEAVTTVDGAVAAAERIGYPVVVKAQVQVGGRGKAGGIKLADDAGRRGPTPGTSSAWTSRATPSRPCGSSWPPTSPRSTTPASPSTARPASTSACCRPRAGSRSRPWRPRTPTPSPRSGSTPSTGSPRTRPGPGWRPPTSTPQATEGAVDILLKLYAAYVEGDADLVEINPLILKPTGEVHALDAKVTLDGNSLFRHPDYAEYEATQVRDEREQVAHDKGLQYVGLDGFVGVIANGAGLAMSTVDIVNQVGGEPANFLDIGGGASAEVMSGALEVINNDPSVRSIFINIFGGITKGEEVANGIVTALGRVHIDVPIVIRLDGTNADLGREILEPHLSDKLQMQPTMIDAAQAVVALAGEGGRHEHLRRRDHQGRLPGPHRQPGPLLRPAQPGVRHPGGGRHQPRKAGTDVEGIPSTPPWARPSPPPAPPPAASSSPPRACARGDGGRRGRRRVRRGITEGVPAHDEAWFYNKLRRDFPDVTCWAPTAPASSAPARQHRHHRRPHRQGPGRRARGRSASSAAPAPSPTRPCTSSSSTTSACPPAWASAATRCPAPLSSTAWSASRPTPRPTPS